MKAKRIFIGILILLLMTSVIYYVGKNLSVTKNTSSVTVQIPENSSVQTISDILYKNSVIKNKYFFMLEYKTFYSSRKIQAGDFVIPKEISSGELIDILSKNGIDTSIVKVTIPEGYTTEQIGQVLQKDGLVSNSDFLNAANNWTDDSYWFLKGVPKDKHMLDGFLFPDTYFLSKKESSQEIIKTMLDEFNSQISPYKDHMTQNKLNVRNVLNVGALVEKEAKVDEDRAKIASVIYNRLNKNMPLQIDATILYVIGHKDKLYTKDLEVQSPYNTYLNKGLPPSPICSPGLKSIKAAIYPDETNYLYYVLDSKTNAHVFASTYAQHLENVKKYTN